MEEDFNSVRNSYEIDDDDAVQAIAGYKPTDDSRICKFYAEKGFCWKQEKCNKEHSLVDPGMYFCYFDKLMYLLSRGGGPTV